MIRNCLVCNAEFKTQPTYLRRPGRRGIFCSVKCRGIEQRQKSGGHLKKDYEGYIMRYQPDHPFARKDGYVREHRLVVERSIDRYLKPEEIIDHINGIKDDNRPENLRIVTHIQNCQNKPNLNITNTSGYSGVVWHKRENLWQAQIHANGEQHFLGKYRNIKGAWLARRLGERLYFDTLMWKYVSK